MRNNLTVDQVLTKLHERFNPVINKQRQGRPKINHKTATATITRDEFSALENELCRLREYEDTEKQRETILEQVYYREEFND